VSKWGNRTFRPNDLEMDSIDSSTSVSHLRNHSLFHKAKKEGDILAAKSVVDDMLKSSVIDSIKSKLQDPKKALIIPVRDQEGSGMNMLPLAYAMVLSGLLEAELVMGVTKVSLAHNTDSTFLDRMNNDIIFDGEIDCAGREVVLVDDTFTVGGTVMALADHVYQQGAHIKAITTLSSGRYGKKIVVEAQ
jgi:phosphoribosylpyrophosphate synthetase